MRWLRWFGPPQDELLLTEFCDTTDAAGVYRKFSTFIVGGRILPRHLFFSRQWMVKSWQLQKERYLREEAEYLDANPHEPQLRQIFSVARVDYGRIDYSLLDGQIQTWEINTNPMIVASGRGGSGARSGIHLRFAARMQKALEDFDTPAATRAKAA